MASRAEAPLILAKRDTQKLPIAAIRNTINTTASSFDPLDALS
jgi:hypothetical protein